MGMMYPERSDESYTVKMWYYDLDDELNIDDIPLRIAITFYRPKKVEDKEQALLKEQIFTALCDLLRCTMNEKIYSTPNGDIHYWTGGGADGKADLVFLPGLTADHRLFDKQIDYFKDSYRVFVWDAPGHAASYPFEMNFSLADKAKWLDAILTAENFLNPVIIGQSMGGYVGQMYSELFPQKLKGFISIDSAPLQRKYLTAAELWLLKRMEPVYRHYPWKWLLKSGTNGVATTDYGRKLMYDMMTVYSGDQERYAKLAGHGFRILAEAIEADLPYKIECPALLICGKKDRAGSCIRYNKAWHKNTGIRLEWIEGAGHNSNTDKPEVVNSLIDEFLNGINTKI